MRSSLPASVMLIGFVATPLDGGVRLTWQTSSETRNLGFRLWRKEATGVFEALTFVPGIGESAGKQDYVVLDGMVGSGFYTYRLQQINFDGDTAMLGAQTVLLGSAMSFSLHQQYDARLVRRRRF